MLESPPLIIFSDEEDATILKVNAAKPQANWLNWSPFGLPSEVATTSDSTATAPSTAAMDHVVMVETNNEGANSASNFEANCSVAVVTTTPRKITNHTAIVPQPLIELDNFDKTTTPVVTNDSNSTAPSTAALDHVALVGARNDDANLASNFEANCSVGAQTTRAKNAANLTPIAPHPPIKFAKLDRTTTPVANTMVLLTPLKGRINGKAVNKESDGGLTPPKSEFVPPKTRKRLEKVKVRTYHMETTHLIKCFTNNQRHFSYKCGAHQRG